MVWPVVEPKRWGCWAYGRVFWMNWGLSLSVIWWITRRYKPMEGVSAWLEYRIRRDGRNGFIRRENAQCGKGSAGFHLGRFEAKDIFLVCGC